MFKTKRKDKNNEYEKTNKKLKRVMKKLEERMMKNFCEREGWICIIRECLKQSTSIG
jgi:hypothetical protein